MTVTYVFHYVFFPGEKCIQDVPVDVSPYTDAPFRGLCLLLSDLLSVLNIFNNNVKSNFLRVIG